MNRRQLLRSLGLLPAALAPPLAGAAGGSGRQRRLGVQLKTPSPSPVSRRLETLRSVRAVPPEIVGAFREPVAFAQAASGQYFVLDRTGHAVYGIDQAQTGAWKIVSLGGEPGRIIQPSGFSLAPNGTFVVADSPGERERLQLFGSGGALLGGFTLPGRAEPVLSLGGVPLNGAGTVHYNGRTLLLGLPATGALISEYSLSGTAIRTFGNLRATGQESDRDVHLGLNSGIPLPAPDGFYFVFSAGVPAFRKFDRDGRLVFERHVEGPELDETVKALPTRWPRRPASPDGPLQPFLPPVVRTAAVSASGELWIVFTVTPHAYVYDATGEKSRVVRFQAAGQLVPAGLSFSHTGRLLVAPGCYEFDPSKG